MCSSNRQDIQQSRRRIRHSKNPRSHEIRNKDCTNANEKTKLKSDAAKALTFVQTPMHPTSMPRSFRDCQYLSLLPTAVSHSKKHLSPSHKVKAKGCTCTQNQFYVRFEIHLLLPGFEMPAMTCVCVSSASCPTARKNAMPPSGSTVSTLPRLQEKYETKFQHLSTTSSLVTPQSASMTVQTQIENKRLETTLPEHNYGNLTQSLSCQGRLPRSS